MMALLEARGLVKRFGRTSALDAFDLAVSAGEVVGLVGHNGAGKTTFARAVAGLIGVDRGSLLVCGAAPGRAQPLIGLAPQELALYPTATARENLLVFAGLYGLRRRAARRRIDALADALVLGDVLDRRVRDLSGGQQRRLHAATAMIHRPKVLLLDEPTVGADPITRDALLEVVRAAAADGACVVYTTHYLPELDVLGATLAVADRGRVVARGDRTTLLAGVSGHAVIDFDTPASDLSIPTMAGGTIHLDGGRVTIRAPDPGGTLAPWLAAHPDASRHLRSIEIHPPTLDDLYRQLMCS
jgi:ABC-2 type transport system ATP-binding protein